MGRREVRSRYEVLGPVGEASSNLLHAIDRVTGHEVALKVLRGATAEEAARFDRETSILATLDHQAIVRYLGHGTTEAGEPCLIMEWLEGETLAARLERPEPLARSDVLVIATRIAEALGAVHAVGIVHRDVKPENVMLVGGRPDEAKLLDFGIARAASASRAVTSEGMVVGTLGYMAPEQARGATALDARTDLFALGCLIFECVARRPAFTGTSVSELLTKVLAAPAPSLSSIVPDVQPALDKLVARLLDRDPAARPQSAAAVLRALAEIDATDAADERAQGEAHSLTAGEVRAPRAASLVPPSLRTARFVGRDRELSALIASLEACIETATPRAALVTGPAGIGKSRLGREFAREAERRGIADAWISHASGTSAGTSVQRMTEVIAELLDPDERSSAEREGGRRAFVAALSAASASRPVVVVVDDLQWSDAYAIDVLGDALRELHDRPFLLLALARPEVHDERPRVANVPFTLEIPLAPLGRRAASELARAWLGERAEEARVARVVARGAGIPLVLEELARAELDGRGAELPMGARALIEGRIASLDAEARRTLRAASIFGDVFWSGGLSALLGHARTTTSNGRLRVLVDRGFVAPREGSRFSGEEEIVFRQTLVREVAYGMLTDADRARGHALAAAWLEEKGAPEAQLHAERAARVRARADEPERLQDKRGARL